MSAHLFLHSMAEFATITLPILNFAKARDVALIGAAHDAHAKLLYDWTAAKGGQLTALDPAPRADNLSWQNTVAAPLRIIAKPSLEGIAEAGVADAWFIDGDHNWYTVYHELLAISEVLANAKRPLLIFLHDVCWPAARRDLYANPAGIPREYLLPHRWDLGMQPNQSALVAGGLRRSLEQPYAAATREGGSRNGVLTAVEDFVALNPDKYFWAKIPAVFGLGVLFDRNHPAAPEIAALLAPYSDNLMFEALEKNRLANYLQVIARQRRVKPLPATSEKMLETERTIMQLIDILSDDCDHPEVWTIFAKEGTLPDQGDLELFVEYIDQLLQLPQPASILKILTILQALCFANLRSLSTSLGMLEDLHTQYPHCPLVTGIFIHVLQRFDRNDERLASLQPATVSQHE